MNRRGATSARRCFLWRRAATFTLFLLPTEGFSLQTLCSGIHGPPCAVSASTKCFQGRDDDVVPLHKRRRWQRFWEQGRSFEVAEQVLHRFLLRSSDPEKIIHGPLLMPSKPLEEDCPAAFADFYRGLINADNGTTEESYLSDDNGPSLAPRRRKQSFRLHLAYDGSYFCGWQRQQHRPSQANLLPSIQETIERAIEDWTGETVDVRVAGRTDAGVHAAGQVGRVRISRRFLSRLGGDLQNGATKQRWEEALQLVLDIAAATQGNSWRCFSVGAASDQFHPIFQAANRSYVYLIDATEQLSSLLCPACDAEDGSLSEICKGISADVEQQLTIIADRLNELFQALEGQTLDYFGFSYGRLKTETTLCRLQHARARLLRYPNSGGADQLALAIELTGDRFLRRMVRVLVSTALLHATCAEIYDPQHLAKLCTARDRRLTAREAPSSGLIFVGAAMRRT